MLDGTKLLPVRTPDIVNVMFELAGTWVIFDSTSLATAVAVAEIVFVTFRFATVKTVVFVPAGLIQLATLRLTQMYRLSGVSTSGCWIDGGRGAKNGVTNRTKIRTTTKRINAHIGTGRRQKLGFFSSIGPEPG